MTSVPVTETLLLRQPALSADHLAFVYAGDLWLADHSGHNVRRLTATPGYKQTPCFSPDGRLLAFSGQDDGSACVYVVPVEGGTPRRLTFHPGDDFVRGWTPAGEVLFASARETIAARVRRLYTLSPEGGHPAALPMPMAERGAFSPRGRHLAYTPFAEPFWSWKRYRGGMTVPVRLLDLETLDEVEVPHENATDTFPCWLDDTLYFLSDRRDTVNVWRWTPGAAGAEQVTFHDDFDVRSLTSGAGRLAYEQGGRVHLLTPGAAPQPLHITVTADFPNTRPRYVPAAPHITAFHVSPTGARAVFAARGEILTVPVGKGDPRNLTNTPGVAERDPAWSPDGQSIAYLSDADGEYGLVVADQKGGVRRTYRLGEVPSFYYTPLWSPDGTRIALTDKALNLSYLVVDTGEVVRVDTDSYDHPERSLDPAWSPDGQWLTYTRRLPNHLRAVFVHDLARGVSHQVSDGMSDAISARFSRDGRLLYFAASVNYGLNTGWLDMSSYERPVTRSLYVAVLRRDDPSPLAPQSDEEPEVRLPGALPAGPATPPEPVRVDLEGLGQRIIALPVPSGEYSRLEPAEGHLFYLERDPSAHADPDGPPGHVLRAWNVTTRETRVFLPQVSDYCVSADGQHLMHAGGQPAAYAVVGVTDPPGPEDGRLDLERVQVRVEPRAEWAQMFEEAVRLHRDFFYDAQMHGLDWAAVAGRYRALVPHVQHREDLNFLLAELAGELVVGHAYVSGGDVPRGPSPRVGLLGADYEISQGRYRFRRILSGLNWNPDLRAPLTEPGVNVCEGEYLLAVNGRPLHAPDSLYAHFEQTADRVTELRVGPTPDDADARTVTVRPTDDERRLRLRAWIEDNRRRVDELSGGRAAYVYMADTARVGYEAFNRYYFSQLDKQAVVLDERFNGGGSVADYVVDLLDRPVLSHWATREGRPFATPNASIFGPKVMIINELAGSGGDALPHFFRRRALGSIVGKRTWGGLIGIYDYPPLIDGGMVTSPRLAIFSPEGEWEVENVGVAPDIEVDLPTRLTAQGRDPQLERAVELVMAELAANPPRTVQRPAPDPRAVRSGSLSAPPSPHEEHEEVAT